MIDKTDKILKEMIELNKDTKDNITLPYIEYLKQKYKCFQDGEQKAREEVIRIINEMLKKNKRETDKFREDGKLILPEGYTIPFINGERLKQKLQGEKK